MEQQQKKIRVVVKQNCNTVSKNQSYLYDHLLTKGERTLLKE